MVLPQMLLRDRQEYHGQPQRISTARSRTTTTVALAFLYALPPSPAAHIQPSVRSPNLTRAAGRLTASANDVATASAAHVDVGCRDGRDLDGDRVEAEATEHLLGLDVDLEGCDRGVEGRDVGDVLVLCGRRRSAAYMSANDARVHPRAARLRTLRSRSSSWSLKEIPRTGPFWIRFMRCVVKPAILLRRRFEGMMATSSMTFLLVWKSTALRRG